MLRSPRADRPGRFGIPVSLKSLVLGTCLVLAAGTAGAADFCDLLMEMRDAGKAVFISTHDIFRAREIADRVGIMKEGHLVMVRDREELKSEDLERIYLDYMRAA